LRAALCEMTAVLDGRPEGKGLTGTSFWYSVKATKDRCSGECTGKGKYNEPT